jgi:putative hydrolases of HD superfamily
LGEAINGDVPAILQDANAPKSDQERRDLLQLTQTLPDAVRAEFLALWEEYEYATTHEARVVKALDKIETIIQHNQGANPPGFDYAFNLGYGRKFVNVHPVVTQLRAIVDEDTQRNAQGKAR